MSGKMVPVVVTTEYKGVFFGYTPPMKSYAVEDIRIERARLCVYWSADVKGVLGLAATGPTAGCKIGPAVPGVTLRKVTAVIEVNPECVQKWEDHPWSK